MSAAAVHPHATAQPQAHGHGHGSHAAPPPVPSGVTGRKPWSSKKRAGSVFATSHLRVAGRRRGRRRDQLFLDLERHRTAALPGKASGHAATCAIRSCRATKRPVPSSSKPGAMSASVKRRRRGLRRRQHVLHRRRGRVRRTVVADDQEGRRRWSAQRHPDSASAAAGAGGDLVARRAAAGRRRRPSASPCSAWARSDSSRPASLTAARRARRCGRSLAERLASAKAAEKIDVVRRFARRAARRRRCTHAIEATGIPSEIARCARILRPGGKIVLLSYYDELTHAVRRPFVKEATLWSAASGRSPTCWRRATRSPRRRRARRRSPAHVVPIERYESAYQTAFNDPSILKVVLQWA